jgi:hypothetical protein
LVIYKMKIIIIIYKKSTILIMVMLLKLEATSKTANSMASGGDMQSMHEGMVSREISNHR